MPSILQNAAVSLPLTVSKCLTVLGEGGRGGGIEVVLHNEVSHDHEWVTYSDS